MFECTTDKYGELYARWLSNPGKMLDLGGLKEGERVIDLCGGTGLVAEEAVRRGASFAVVVDLKPRIKSDVPISVGALWGRAEHLDALLEQHMDNLHEVVQQWNALAKGRGRPLDLPSCPPGCRCKFYEPGTFDLVVCRQAINYLHLDETALAVYNALKPGGRFVFNTFGKPRWLAKSYRFDGRRFFEAAGFWRDHVVHVQAGLGIGIDVSKFRWYAPDQIRAAMERYFLVTARIQGNSTYYICRKAVHVRKLV